MNKFHWSNFDSQFINSVVYSVNTDIRYQPIPSTHEKDFLIASINAIAEIPSRSFVMKYRDEIENDFLHHNESIVLEIGRHMRIIGTNYLSVLHKLSKHPMSESLLNAYIRMLLKIGGSDVELTGESRFRSRLSIDLINQSPNDITLYDFQKDAVHALTQHFVTEDKNAGLLVLPTGSGKTRTAVYFLLSEMVSRGYQVLWLAHRHMLIDQAADCFYNCTPLLKLKNESMKRYELICVSGMHKSIRNAEKSDTVLIASIPSVCKSLPFLKRVLQKKVIIVIDEAHHTLAPSYQNTIKMIKKARPDVKLLGLTATPIRFTTAGSIALRNLYNNSIVYNKSMSELITKRFLADPVFDQVKTGVNFESSLSREESKYISRQKELPESVISRIAECRTRNEIIVDTYLKKKKQYGKTLIFAMNIAHCKLLSKELSKHCRCDYIHAGRPGNGDIVQRFKGNELDVLININIMTEGSDVPDIESVFLTRPTQSDGLLMQMIGRGMRGINANGTEKVNIVDFIDRWETFNSWLNPKSIIEVPGQVDEDLPGDVYHKGTVQPISDELLEEVYQMIGRSNIRVDVNTALPIGWYALIDENGEDTVVLVYEDQLMGYSQIIEHKDQYQSVDNVDLETIQAKYFGGFCLRPSGTDIMLIIDYIHNHNEVPEFFQLNERNEIDPISVGRRVRENKLNPIEEAQKLYDMHGIIRFMYSSLHNYTMKIVDNYFTDPDRIVYGTQPIAELPINLIPHRITPTYNLDELMQEVISEMFGGKYEGISDIAWTDKPYVSYLGLFYFSDNHIMINLILDSPDIPREAVKLIIYHELLHRDYHIHNKQFRQMEMKYPDYTNLDAFLMSIGDKMAVQGW